MSLPFTHAPHAVGAPGSQAEAPNAALLIDFDNVTMGMRSDLSKELKNLLSSDIIKGKVTVQRAYADWRRYPQYIVPLSEHSVDLIFAPAYGSSKKNATDIRMAIDGMELVFIRPEIGTFILLTGDSDFSSLVLKLKEYGKYVIGVGIQESSSDILVQNCDEYYSYTSLTGLRKTTDSANKPVDPWILVEEAVKKMASRNDVMRSDRLKQVMIEIDQSFDEGNFGFSKFSRFLSEAASRDLVILRKLENGQYEVHPYNRGKGESGKGRSHAPKKGNGRERPREDKASPARRRSSSKTEPATEDKGGSDVQTPPKGGEEVQAGSNDPLQDAYDLMRKALGLLSDGAENGPVRDSDLKRKMLELNSAFDEGELGFGKFSRFLRQAHDHEVVDLEKREEGTYQVTLRKEAASTQSRPSVEPQAKSPTTHGAGTKPAATDASGTKAGQVEIKGLGPRRGERRGSRGKDDPPPLLEGQVVRVPGSAPPRQDGAGSGPAQGSTPAVPGDVDISKLGLPTGRAAVIRYLTNSYKGVGAKTAESLVDAFGGDLFRVLQTDPDKISTVVPGKRAEQLLEGWKVDYERRVERMAPEPDASSDHREADVAQGAKDGRGAETDHQRAEKDHGAEVGQRVETDHGAEMDQGGEEDQGGESPEEEAAQDEPKKKSPPRRRTRKGGRSRNR